MTQALTEYDRYADQYANVAGSGPTWLHNLRQKGFDNFSRLGFPTARRGNEAWKYTNVAPVARAEFSVSTSDESPSVEALRDSLPWVDDWNTLVFVNGRFSPELSIVHDTGSVTVSGLSALVESDGTVARQHLGSLASVEDDGFAALNTAFIGDGAVVHVPDNVRVERPVHLAFVSTEEVSFVAHPRVLVVAGSESEATVVESYMSLGENPYFTNAVTEVVVEEGARVEHYRLMDESDESYHVGVARVRQKDGSSFSSRAFYKGVGLGRHDLYALIGDGCETDLSGLYITSGSQHMDNFINLDHAQPNSTSRLYYKGILSGRSRAVFGGTVFVREGADKTDSLQSDKNLLLSPDAEVDSKPALFIWADDVKCGHGATAGNVDEDTVFYMRSRGVDLETASRLLIFGFASEIIDTVALSELREYLERSFLEAIPKYEFNF
ncbi:MAG: Fe-S cluster assembly protein SufD [Dehalococcoidia bacterium]|nr:Fe-S cluster assembly protein SufD [Dehalococcoidia bacterium]